MNCITVLLAEDHRVVRQGLRKLLATETDFTVIGEALTGREAVALAKKLRPAVVVMDIAMPLLNGLEATRQIRLAQPDVKVLILSAYSDDAYIDQALTNGAAGYLIKQTSSRDLCQAIRAVQQGHAFFSPEIARRLQEPSATAASTGRRKRVPRLTSRELEVLQWIAEGAPNQQVARELGISIKTVEKHRQSMMRKLNVHEVAGLTRYAIGAGIIKNIPQMPLAW